MDMRAAKILSSGVGALLLAAVVIVYFKFAVLSFAASVGLAVLAGSLVPGQRFIGFMLPALQEFPYEEVVPGVTPQPYPQLFVFRCEVRNLWLLVVSPFYSLSLAAFVLSRPDLRWEGSFAWEQFPGPFIRIFAGWVTGLAVFFAWRWLVERVLLQRADIGLGGIHALFGPGEVTYEYFDRNGDRRGGMATIFSSIVSPLSPVFIHTRLLHFSLPGFAFLFHRFTVVDSRHLPSGTLAKLQSEVISK